MGEPVDNTPPEQHQDAAGERGIPEDHKDQDDLGGYDGFGDSNYLPSEEEEESLGFDDFIIPEEPLDPKAYRRRLIETARSLKAKERQLKAE